MTPLIGLCVAAVAALLAPNTRAVVGCVTIGMLSATFVQTWDLDDDWGSNPPSTVHQLSYWVVQLIVLAVVLAVAVGLFGLRVRRATRTGQSLVRPSFSGRRGAMVLAVSTLALTTVAFAGAYIASKVRSVHGRGQQDIPWTGVLGIVIGLVLIVACVVALRVGLRADRRQRIGG